MAEDLLKCLFFTVEIILSDESIAHGLNQKLKSTDNLLLGGISSPSLSRKRGGEKGKGDGYFAPLDVAEVTSSGDSAFSC